MRCTEITFQLCLDCCQLSKGWRHCPKDTRSDKVVDEKGRHACAADALGELVIEDDDVEDGLGEVGVERGECVTEFGHIRADESVYLVFQRPCIATKNSLATT